MGEKMKVAYCFCGHMRTFEHTAHTFYKHIFNIVPGDIYIHTWADITQPEGTWWRDSEKVCRKVLESEIRNVYPEAKAIVIEEQSLVLTHWKGVVNNSISKIYETATKSFELAVAGGEYDVFFMLRPDLWFCNDITPGEVFDNDSFWVNRHDHFTNMGEICGLFSHSNYDYMRYNLDCYWNVGFWLYQPYINGCGCPHGEVALNKYLRQNERLWNSIKLSGVGFRVMRHGVWFQDQMQEITKFDPHHLCENANPLKGKQVVQWGGSDGFGFKVFKKLCKYGIAPDMVVDTSPNGKQRMVYNGHCCDVLCPDHIRDGNNSVFVIARTGESKIKAAAIIEKLYPMAIICNIGHLLEGEGE